MMSKLPEEGRQGRESGDRFPVLFSVPHTMGARRLDVCGILAVQLNIVTKRKKVQKDFSHF